MTLRDKLRNAIRDLRRYRVDLKTERRWKMRKKGEPHTLRAPLIVSLTSFPPRFDTLHIVLKSLLTQTLAADSTVLWISRDEVSLLPSNVKELTTCGLTIKACDEIRSFKKIIPTLESAPDSFIVTADDDTAYWDTWLAELVEGWDPDRPSIVAHRARRIHLDESGQPTPYSTWPIATGDSGPSSLIFPTGVGGVFYPPGVFSPNVTDRAMFTRLSPGADDVWLYWMWRLESHLAVTLNSFDDSINITTEPDAGLHEHNVAGGMNDVFISNMIEEYGFPPF